MRRMTIGLLVIGLVACMSRYTPPESQVATLLAYPPDAFNDAGVVQILIYPEGCPIDRGDEPQLLGTLYGKANNGGPVPLTVAADQKVVLQTHFLRENISCRAHMEVALRANRSYELRTSLNRMDRHWDDELDEYLCSFMIPGVRSTGSIKPGEGKPEC